MKAHYPTALSLIGHAVLIGVLSLVTFRVDKKAPRKAGMEFEIIDSTHALAIPGPAVGQQASTGALSANNASPITVPPSVTAEPSQVPVLHRGPSPAPEAAAPLTTIKTLGPGPVVELQPSVPQAPMLPAPARPAPQAVIIRPELIAPIVAPPVPVVAGTHPQAALQAPSGAKFDPSKIAASLGAALSRKRQVRLDSAAIGSALGRAVPKGEAALTERQRINLKELIRKQIHPCWNPPAKEEGEGLVTVTLPIKLDRAGRLIGEPSGIALTGQTGTNAAYARGLSASVVRAVKRCTPLKLPSELYAAWAEIELNFDPRDIQ